MAPNLTGDRSHIRMCESRGLTRGQIRSVLSSAIIVCFCLLLPGLTAALVDPADSIQKLTETLNQKNASEQRKAALELAKLKDPRALRALVNTLKSPDPTARKYAALALGEMKDPRSIEALRQSLGDKNENVVAEVRTALILFGKAAEPTLTAALNDKNPRIQWRAAELLGYLKNKSGTNTLL